MVEPSFNPSLEGQKLLALGIAPKTGVIMVELSLVIRGHRVHLGNDRVWKLTPGELQDIRRGAWPERLKVSPPNQIVPIEPPAQGFEIAEVVMAQIGRNALVDLAHSEFENLGREMWDCGFPLESIDPLHSLVAELAEGRRTFLSEENREFLELLVGEMKRRGVRVPRGTVLWRAQSGCVDLPSIAGGYSLSHPAPHPVSRMLPRPHLQREGRANLKGVTTLYVATHPETAMYEIRPWTHQPVTLAEIIPQRDLNLVNLTGHRIRWRDAVPEVHEAHRPAKPAIDRALARINEAFALPVSSTDDTQEYALCQLIAESLRHHTLQGILYKSSWGEGFNVAIFGNQNVEVGQRSLFRPTNPSWTFTPISLSVEDGGSQRDQSAPDTDL